MWKLHQSNKSLWDKLKRIPKNPYAAFKSMMEPPEIRIRNSHKHNVVEPIEELEEAETKHFLLDIRPEQFLVYGHTHYPYINDEKKVANTGSWGFDDQKKFCYMEIVDDKVDLKEFD